MVCKKCGNEINDNATFCKHCGAKITADEEKNIGQTISLGDKAPEQEEHSQVLNKLLKTTSSIKRILIIAALCVCLSGIYKWAMNQNRNASNGVEDHKVLMVDMKASVFNSDNISDTTQVENALRNGGYILVDINKDTIKQSFSNYYMGYGAENSNGEYYISGAVINYIAHKGWTLIEAPNSAYTGMYTFVK